jgi:hypothetical protein
MEQNIQSWTSHERRYTLTSKIFTKSELPQEDIQWSIITKTKIQPRWSRERLPNEAKTLHFIASNTKIPVLEFISLYEDNDDLLHLQTKRARGVPLNEIDRTHAAAAVQKVDEC